METITIPLGDTKGRVKPDLTAKSNQPDAETILIFAGQIKQKKALVDKARKALDMIRKQAKNAGIGMRELDEEMRNLELEPDELMARIQRKIAYAEALGNEVKPQLDLFNYRKSGILTWKEQSEKAYQSGLARGLMGDDCDDQAYEATSELGQEHMRGWQAGQKVLLERFASLSEQAAAVEAAKKAKMEKKAAKKSAGDVK